MLINARVPKIISKKQTEITRLVFCQEFLTRKSKYNGTNRKIEQGSLSKNRPKLISAKSWPKIVENNIEKSKAANTNQKSEKKSTSAA